MLFFIEKKCCLLDVWQAFFYEIRAKKIAYLSLLRFFMKSPVFLIFFGMFIMPHFLGAQAIRVKPNKPAPSEAVLVRPKLDPESVPLDKPLETNVATLGKPTGDDAIRLQIFLDQQNFGPGVIDGKPGLFTEQAVKAWNEVHGHPIDDWNAALVEARRSVPIPIVEVKVPDILKIWVNPELSYDRIEQAKAKKILAYRSVAEFMSERYHTDIDFLSEINGPKFPKNLAADAVIKVPNVSPFLVESIAGVKFPKDES